MIQILLCDDDHQIRAEIEKQINNQILICQSPLDTVLVQLKKVSFLQNLSSKMTRI